MMSWYLKTLANKGQWEYIDESSRMPKKWQCLLFITCHWPVHIYHIVTHPISRVRSNWVIMEIFMEETDFRVGQVLEPFGKANGMKTRNNNQNYFGNFVGASGGWRVAGGNQLRVRSTGGGWLVGGGSDGVVGKVWDFWEGVAKRAGTEVWVGRVGADRCWRLFVVMAVGQRCSKGRDKGRCPLVCSDRIIWRLLRYHWSKKLPDNAGEVVIACCRF